MDPLSIPNEGEGVSFRRARRPELEVKALRIRFHRREGHAEGKGIRLTQLRSCCSRRVTTSRATCCQLDGASGQRGWGAVEAGPDVSDITLQRRSWAVTQPS